MLRALQWAFWVIGLGLQVLVLSAAVQGVAREFPALFAYVVCLFGTTLADIVASQFLGKASHSFKLYYWCAELVRQSALFAMVVALAMHVVPPGRRNEAFTRLIALLGAAVWIGSVMLLPELEHLDGESDSESQLFHGGTQPWRVVRIREKPDQGHKTINNRCRIGPADDRRSYRTRDSATGPLHADLADSQHFHRTHAFSLSLSLVARLDHGN
jgi:hypothetical protein